MKPDGGHTTAALIPLSQSYLAAHEVASANIEDAIFSNINQVCDVKPEGVPDNDRSARLNGGVDSLRMGTAIILQVMAGDKINLRAYSYHDGGKDTTLEDIYAGAEDMMNSIVGIFLGGAGGYEGGETHNGTNTVPNLFTSTNYLETYEGIKEDMTDVTKPRAYLNYLVFTNDMTLDHELSGAIQVSGNRNSWESLELPSELVMANNGYIAVYISNEQDQDVWFDDVTITHSHGRLQEEQHYYPHGLLSSHTTSSGVPENKFRYQGKLMQDELGMQLYDFHARQYDPQIGRFWGIDPADQFPSGYTGMGNDPANMIDPSGAYTIPNYKGYYAAMNNRWIQSLWERVNIGRLGSPAAANEDVCK